MKLLMIIKALIHIVIYAACTTAYAYLLLFVHTAVKEHSPILPYTWLDITALIVWASLGYYLLITAYSTVSKRIVNKI